MNEFETRWQAAIDAVRQAPPRDESAPFGFSRRITALRRNAATGSTFLLWWKLTWRAIGFAALVLVASMAMNWSASNDAPLDPGIADSMSDLLWLP